MTSPIEKISISIQPGLSAKISLIQNVQVHNVNKMEFELYFPHGLEDNLNKAQIHSPVSYNDGFSKTTASSLLHIFYIDPTLDLLCK